MSKKAQLETMLEQKAEELKEIHRQLQAEEEAEELANDDYRIPPQVQVAVTALRMLHRSLRMESASDMEDSGSEDYPSGLERKEKHRQHVRRLANSEARLRDVCCYAICEYIQTAKPHEVSVQTQDDPEDLQSLED